MRDPDTYLSRSPSTPHRLLPWCVCACSDSLWAFICIRPKRLKMLSYGIEIQFPYEIRHKLVELFGTKSILIVVYAVWFNCIVGSIDYYVCALIQNMEVESRVTYLSFYSKLTTSKIHIIFWIIFVLFWRGNLLNDVW